MNLIWLPISVPLVVMAVMIAMDHVQRRLVDAAPRNETPGPAERG